MDKRNSLESNTFIEVIKGQKVVACIRRMDDIPEVLNHDKIKTIFVLN